MSKYIEIDSSIEKSDWVKKQRWDFPGVETLEDFVGGVGLPEESDTELKNFLIKFLELPASYPMPDKLRKEIYVFIDQSPINPKFVDKISWCIDAVFEVFPEEAEKITELCEKIKKDKIRFYDDLAFEDQMFVLDLETREIEIENYPLSQFKQDLEKIRKK